jgi:hypothetical protein
VPVELSPTSVERALALLGEHDLEAPGDVEGALEMIAGREDEEAPVEISRYDLQLFLWYQLPCKLLDSLGQRATGNVSRRSPRSSSSRHSRTGAAPSATAAEAC